MNTIKRWLLYLLMISIFSLAVVATGIWGWLNKPLPLEDALTLELDKGSSLYRALQELSAKGVVSYPKILGWYARLTQQTSVKFGEYRLEPSVTPRQLLVVLVEGRVLYRAVTLIEGHSLLETLQRLRKDESLLHRLPVMDTRSETQLLSEFLGVDAPNPEGWLYPDTYHFGKGTTDQVVVLQAYERMQQVLSDEWAARAEGLPYATAYDALIMASIVEKETGVAHERAEIAGVFVRRLNKGMRLQTDPTVIYGMGDAYAGDIRRRDLKKKTPYNTYTMNGLPPTPIALAGREAIHAALHPAQGDALYFVARGDGTHIFSATLAEHQRAVRRFQMTRREGYRSSPKAQ